MGKKNQIFLNHCTEVHFAIFLSSGLNIIISHTSKSMWVIKLSFWKNDFRIGGSFRQKDSLITHILFELWQFMIFSPKERKLAKRTSVHCRVLTKTLYDVKEKFFWASPLSVRVKTPWDCSVISLLWSSYTMERWYLSL